MTMLNCRYMAQLLHAACHGESLEILGSTALIRRVRDLKSSIAQSGALSRAEVEEKMMSLVGEDIVTRLKSSNWKDRLGAMEDLQSRTQDMKENVDAIMLIQVITLSAPADM